MASIKKIYNTSGEDVEQLESSYIAGANARWYNHSGKVCWFFCLSFLKIIYLAVLGLLCCVDFSPVALIRGYSRRSIHAAHCSDFSCCRAQALGHLGYTNCGSPALEHRFNSCGTQA